MDGRLVALDHGHVDGSRFRQGRVSQEHVADEDETSIDESDLFLCGGRGPDADEEEENEGRDADGNDGEEIVLSRDEFDLLQAFHRLVPLPALRSQILRVVCDDDLEVTEDDAVVGLPPAADRIAADEPAPFQSIKPLSLSSSAGLIPVVSISGTKHSYYSPLTRRLSTKTVGGSLTKPRREIDLAAQTPRIKRLTTPTSVDARHGDGRVG